MQIRRRGSFGAMPMIRLISKMEAQMTKLAFVNSSYEVLDPQNVFWGGGVSKGKYQSPFPLPSDRTVAIGAFKCQSDTAMCKMCERHHTIQ